MSRLSAIALLLLAFACGPAFADGSAEAAVVEIERLGTTAHWRESNARIAALSAQPAALTEAQRDRVEFVRLRNLGLSGEQTQALDGLAELLRKDLPAPLRVRAYTTAISIAGNVENWTLAFALLGDGLPYLPEAPADAPALLGAASYLHTLVGETDKARDLALRALQSVESAGNPRSVCLAVADVAMAEDHAGNVAQAVAWRHRQIAACRAAGDLVFTANGEYGVGKMLARQGQHVEALKWSRKSLADFETAGFAAGAWSARLGVAESLIAGGEGLDEADALLTDTLRYYRGEDSHLAIAETEGLFARLAERRGDPARALDHYRRSMEASAAAERDARARRLAYLQVEFDTRMKEQQIALLEAEKELAALQVTATKRRQLLLAGGMAGLLVTAILLFGLLRRSIRERRRYRWQSERDGLTRLYNYQQVRKLGEEAFARARAQRKPFTAIVTDIDLFKQVNDRYGHAAGDEALRSLGTWIDEVVGERGIAGRSGGDEFTILVEADAAAAEALMQRLRGRLEPITVFGQRFDFDFSAGICQDDGETSTLEQLIHCADRALYRAKHDGRGREVLAGAASVNAAGRATAATGALVLVGCGIEFGRHVSERCLSEIREAEVVFCLVDPFALGMIQRFRPDAINLGVHYLPGRDRRETYREIDAVVMAEVEAGRHVCAVFYGHPGVFADVPHALLRKAREQGIPARMEPGISAEACLYADIGIDPGRRGVQSMEATHFMVYDRRPDTAGLVLLWQVALSGDLSCTRLHAERDGLQALVDKLLRWYPAHHEVILYEAAQLPIGAARIDRLALRDLPAAHYEEYTTLVIPAFGELRDDPRLAGG